MGRVVLIVALVGLLGVGLLLSFRDYRAWKYEETKNYGHGPGELYTPADLFTEHYQNQLVGVKFNYPGGWSLKANSKLEYRNPKQSLNDVLKGGEMEEVVRFEKSDAETRQWMFLKVGLNENGANLVDIVNKDIQDLAARGEEVVGEREYQSSDRDTWTIVNYVLEGEGYKKAYTIHDKRIMEVEFMYDPSTEMKVVRTYEEWVKNIIII